MNCIQIKQYNSNKIYFILTSQSIYIFIFYMYMLILNIIHALILYHIIPGQKIIAFMLKNIYIITLYIQLHCTLELRSQITQKFEVQF